MLQNMFLCAAVVLFAIGCSTTSTADSNFASHDPFGESGTFSAPATVETAEPNVVAAVERADIPEVSQPLASLDETSEFMEFVNGTPRALPVIEVPAADILPASFQSDENLPAEWVDPFEGS